ncbi:transposase [Actinomadura rudentiformis]|uniref:Transposase n=1 Tax=Actinomadura rudentiformis TaxID=359158 RepID=A0A6H9YUS1_9ACTN|nr:transposase [Actinomadura rudentiformis]KAB2343619.1 transposase [Actinomadura rudentiformis]
MRKGEQPPWIVPDSLWERIEPLLPKVERGKRHNGRRRLDDRRVLCGILFVLRTGIRWEFLVTWTGRGAVIDSSHVRALKGGPNRAEPGRPWPAGL